MTHNFEGTVGNHFVGIHVGSCTGTSLNHIHREVFVMLAVHNFTASLFDGLSLSVGQEAECVIGAGSCHLGYSQAIDEARVVTQMKITDREVFDTSQSLYAIEGA